MPKKDKPPLHRRRDLEDQLCRAIAGMLRVKLRYDDDFSERTVDPYGVYTSSKDKILLACQQIDNPEKPSEDFEPRNLEVANIKSLRITDTKFRPDDRFDPFDKRYANGFICRIK